MKTPKDVLAFDRWDRMVLIVALWLIAAAAAAFNVIAPIIAWGMSEPLAVPYSGEFTVPQLDRIGTAYNNGTYNLLISDSAAWQWLVFLVPGVFVTCLILACVVLIQRVMRHVGNGDPFAPGQVVRLRLVAALLVLGMPLLMFIRVIVIGTLLGSIDLGGLEPAAVAEIPWLPVLAGLVVALLAEAFKNGAALRSDVVGLI